VASYDIGDSVLFNGGTAPDAAGTTDILGNARPEPFFKMYSIGAVQGQFIDNRTPPDPIRTPRENLSEGDYKFLWLFGDGESSTERNPYHVYKMPGEYTAVRIRTYPDGSEDRNYFLIRGYDWDLVGDGIHVTFANRCFRTPVSPMQGVGISEYGGEHWLYPEAYVSVCNATDRNNITISIVLDTRTGRHFRIAVKNQWLDRLDNFGYVFGGFEIPCRFKLKEHMSNQGEFEDVEHIETYIYMRPHQKTDRELDGYRADSFRDEFEVDMNMYVDDETAEDAVIKKVPLKADYVMRKKIRASRIQAEIITSASSFRCVGVQQRVEEIDKKPGTTRNTKSETNWQREFRTPDFWISRDSTRPILNRATGVNCGGSYNSLITGPDDVPNSALFFGASDGLTFNLTPGSVNTLSWWISGISSDVTVWQFANNSIRIIFQGGAYNLSVGGRTIRLDWDGVSWIFLAVVFQGDEFRVYMNKTAMGRFDGTVTTGGGTVLMQNSAGNIFDARRVLRQISKDALDYYYDTIGEDGGDNGFLPIMR